MQFIDNTGHIFYQQSYSELPIGYEYETNDYIFWIDDENYCGHKLSIDNYYIKPIRALVSNKVDKISIKIDSKIFNLISSSSVQQKLSSNNDLSSYIEFEENSDDFKQTLNTEDIFIIKDDEFTIIPFYVVCKSDEEATWNTQILIKVTYQDRSVEYCPITIGAVFYDESEELIINGKNIGVNLPKNIINAIYQHSIYSDISNDTLYNEKLKEYLMNFMNIKGECGNFNSAINSLKWFGYGDKVKLTKLLKTDNTLLDQYVRDSFDISNDIIDSFKKFNPTAFISLTLLENQEIEDTWSFDFNKDFYGEGKCDFENLFDKLTSYSKDDIEFYASYYKWTFEEFAIKLSYLKYFYEKYFLPIHMKIHSSSIERRCYANDIKLTTVPFSKICSKPVLMQESDVTVKFPSTKNQYIYTSKHYVDENFNEFTNTEDLGRLSSENIYYIDDLCIPIKVKFDSIYPDKFFDVVYILERNEKPIYESHFSFTKQCTFKTISIKLTDEDIITTDSKANRNNKNLITETIFPSLNEKYIVNENGSEETVIVEVDKILYDYDNFVIVPKIFNSRQNINYWLEGSYTLHVMCNGKWFDYSFNIKVPEFKMNFGHLEYEYDNRLARQISSITDEKIDFLSHMYLPSLVDVNNINFPKEVLDYSNKKTLQKFINQYKEGPSISSSKKYYNRIHYYKLFDVESGKEIEYDNNQNIIQLYRNFFNDDGSSNGIFSIDNDNFHYDMYLMHDDINNESYKGILSDVDLRNFKPYWYIIFISKETLDSKMNPNDDIALKEISTNSYRIEWQKSDNKFLINRMKYVAANGVNKFNKDDIIVGSISNTDFPFILELGSKWHISPYSLKMNNDADVYSNTNTFIMSMGGSNANYESGFYDVTVRYSIDGEVQNQSTKKCRILVK